MTILLRFLARFSTLLMVVPAGPGRGLSDYGTRRGFLQWWKSPRSVTKVGV